MSVIDYVNEKFPLNELSYDKLHHKKVPNCFLAIPKGKSTTYGSPICRTRMSVFS